MDYKQAVKETKFWQRCRAVTCLNPVDSPYKTVVFQEELASEVDGVSSSVKDVGSCSTLFSPDGEINLIDPSTGQSTGETVSHLKLYQILHSLYIQVALERDAREAALANPPPQE